MNFQLEEILAVIDHVKAMDLALFEYRDQDVRIKIRGRQETGKEERRNDTMTEQGGSRGMAQGSRKSDEKRQSEETEAASGQLYIQKSPMVGTFYAASSEDAEPFVKAGDTIKKGQTVGIIEAMKLMNEVSADCSGVVEAIVAENEQMVEYGQPLLRIRREE